MVPVYNQSAVKIAKKLVKKVTRNNCDIWKAVLDWMNTPAANMNSSPVQSLMSRGTRHSLPTAKELYVVDNTHEKILLKRQESMRYYNK